VLRFIAFLLVTAIAGWGAWLAYNRFTPPQDNPFKPLDLLLPPGLATAMKLDRLADDGAFCRQLLEAADVEYGESVRPVTNPACSLEGALRLQQSLTPYTGRLDMTCPLTAALHVWERHVARPAAEELLGSPLARIETFGSYSCRPVRGGRPGRWSEHATGNAIDIAAFVLEDGRRITVADHFGAEDAAGEFLERVREGGCRLFATTLGPDYNALHRDHFHFDMGRYSICS
jgi:hypothetical protein